MRVELRLEMDDREFEVALVADRAVSPQSMVTTAVDALRSLTDEPFILPHQR